MRKANGRGAKKRQIFLKIVFEVGGEENERQMANNVMQEMRVYDGYLVYFDLALIPPATAPEILPATS